MKKLLILVCMAVTLSLTANAAEVTCWEQARRYWIRAPAKEKQFEEYVVFYAMDKAVRFFSCLTEECAKVREQNDNDVMNYIKWGLTDSFMVRQYYTMEEHFESELSTLDFRHWKRNNEHWKEGYNWQEFTFQANHCPVLVPSAPRESLAVPAVESPR